MKFKNWLSILYFSTFMFSCNVQADPVVINNNQNSGQGTTSACPPANQNNIYDSRVPPAGVYSTQNVDGSTNQIYTTGEKKPYITDNNCNSNSNIQPYVTVAPPYGPRPPHH